MGLLNPIKSLIPTPIKTFATLALRGDRRLTAFMRVLPNCIMPGAPRSGTTSLYRYLSQHPRIVFSIEKEPRFFTNQFYKGMVWYRSLFPTIFRRWQMRLAYGQAPIIAEATTHYLFEPPAAPRLAEYIPDPRFIILLRDPVDRTYSGYHNRVKYGQERLSFEEVVSMELDVISGQPEEWFVDGEFFGHYEEPPFLYLTQSLYVYQLQRLARYFARERMLILKSEEFFSDPLAALRQIVAFLGLPMWEPWEDMAFEIHNRNYYTEMGGEMRARLADFFAPHNQRLYDWLGADLGWE
jgi:hypothetical protein